MQSDIPPLPISCLADSIRLRRNSKKIFDLKVSTKNNSYKSHTTNPTAALVSTKKKQLEDFSPYKNSARLNPPDTGKSSGQSAIGQRVSSAKMLRIKQLQNQLADAHFHLNELSNENKLLKAIQKRQDVALKRYEGTNAELPRIINTHHEDLRVLQNKYKKLKSQYKETSDLLKDKEIELHSLQVQNKKLLQLSKDRHLGERDKLQTQVADLNHRIDQQDEIIQTLRRKLALESKYLKHQLHAEMAKHKDTQKQLEDSQSKLKKLQELWDQREKRSFHARNVIFYNRDRPSATSQSLTNLNDNRIENLIKAHSFRRRRSEAIGQSLPSLNDATASFLRSQEQEISQVRQKFSQEAASPMTETLMNYEQIKNFRLQRSPALHRAAAFSTSRGSLRDSPIKESQLEEANDSRDFNVSEEIADQTYELPKTLFRKEYQYDSDDEKISNSGNVASGSRSLHARLVSSANEVVRTNRITSTTRSRSLTKENMENIMENEKAEMKYDRDSVVTVISRDTLIKEALESTINYSSSSDLESEVEIPIEFNNDELDDNITRKSDINITEVRNQPNLSKVFNEFKRSPDLKDDPELANLEQLGFKSVDGIWIGNNESKSDSTDKSLNNLLTQKRFSSDECPLELPQNDSIPKDLSEKNNENSTLVQITKNQDEKCTEKLVDRSFDESISHNNVTDSAAKSSTEQKTESSKTFDKAKLLAAMKAIDDNENIEIVDKSRKNTGTTSRLKITENLYKGRPTHSTNKSDIMKELFADTKLNKTSKKNTTS